MERLLYLSMASWSPASLAACEGAGRGGAQAPPLATPGRRGAAGPHLQGVGGLLAAAEALVQQVQLELRGLAVEDVDGLDAGLEHPGCAEEHALQVAGDVARLVREQLLAHAAHGYEELVDVHAGVDGDLAAKVVVELLRLDAPGRVVAQHLGEAVDPHAAASRAGWREVGS
jgi:hypothetical protein